MAERRSRRRRRHVQEGVVEEAPEIQESEVEEEDPIEVEESEEDVSAPVAERRRSRAASGTVGGQQLLKEVFGELEVGKAVVITRVGDDEYTLVAKDAEVVAPAPERKVRRVSSTVFFTDQFKKWQAEWSQKSYEDKVAYAKEHAITWDANEDPGIDAMRIGMAVREQEKVVKYKQGFTTIKERRDAKAKLEAGLDIEGIEL